MHVGDKKLFLIQGDCPQSFNWDEHGLRISVPKNTLSSKETVELAIAVLVGGEFQFPKETEAVSAIYSLSITKPLAQPIKFKIQHCAQLVTQDHTAYLTFVKASSNQDILPYNFQIVEGGRFYPGSQYGSILLHHFCLVTIVKSLFGPVTMLFQMKYDSKSSEDTVIERTIVNQPTYQSSSDDHVAVRGDASTAHISTGEAQYKEGKKPFDLNLNYNLTIPDKQFKN